MTTRIDRHQTFDRDGNLIAEQVEEVDITAEVNERTLSDRAGQAIQANLTYLAIQSPTAGEVRAQVDRLTRQNQALIRLVVGLLDDVD